MNASSPFELAQVSGGLESIQLPAEVVKLLKAEARRSRKSVAATLTDWLEDQADGREAHRRMKALRSGKTRAIPAEEVYKRLGI